MFGVLKAKLPRPSANLSRDSAATVFLLVTHVERLDWWSCRVSTVAASIGHNSEFVVVVNRKSRLVSTLRFSRPQYCSTDGQSAVL